MTAAALIPLAVVLLGWGVIFALIEWRSHRTHDVDATLPDTGWITALAEQTRTEERRVDQAMRAGIEEGA